MPSAFQLVLIPALGCDERLFEPQRRAFPDLFVPPWLPITRERTLAEYAGRLAATIPARRPLILGGVSLGGMLAWEMAPLLKPDAVVLIASCRTRPALGRFFRATRPLLSLLPTAAFELSKPLAKLFGARISVPGPHRQLLISMYCATDTRRLRWSCRAALDWRPRADDHAVPVFQIHGARDFVIPPDNVTPDRLILGGGHVINLTHAEEVNAFLAEVAQRTGVGAR